MAIRCQGQSLGRSGDMIASLSERATLQAAAPRRRGDCEDGSASTPRRSSPPRGARR